MAQAASLPQRKPKRDSKEVHSSNARTFNMIRAYSYFALSNGRVLPSRRTNDAIVHGAKLLHSMSRCLRKTPRNVVLSCMLAVSARARDDHPSFCERFPFHRNTSHVGFRRRPANMRCTSCKLRAYTFIPGSVSSQERLSPTSPMAGNQMRHDCVSVVLLRSTSTSSCDSSKAYAPPR